MVVTALRQPLGVVDHPIETGSGHGSGGKGFRGAYAA
jgi:hypothetical protein